MLERAFSMRDAINIATSAALTLVPDGQTAAVLAV